MTLQITSSKPAFKFNFSPQPAFSLKPEALHNRSILAKDFEEEEKASVGFKFHQPYDERMVHVTGTYLCTLTANFEKIDSMTSEFMFEDVIVEYMSNPGKEEKFRYKDEEHNCSYLETYAKVGIPLKRYKWILGSLKAETFAPTCRCRTMLDGYAWIIVQLPENNPVECTMTTFAKGGTVSVGPLADVVNHIKSNVRGFGSFEIVVKKGDPGSYPFFLDFTLARFQMVDTTKVSSAVKAPASVIATGVLMEALKDFNISTTKK